MKREQGKAMSLRGKINSLDLKGKSVIEIKKEIIDAIRNISSDPQMIDKFQRFMKQFHNYSLWNVLLIFLQFAGASQVAGFRTWQKLGRAVKKGEKAIWIFAPLLKKVEDEVKDAAQKKVVKVFRGFKKVAVFAFEQTSGEKLEVPPIGALVTRDPNEVYARLKQVAMDAGLAVKEIDMPFAQGGSTDGRTVWVNALNPVEGRCMTIIHEIAHVMLGHAGERKTIPRARKEVEAECCAFLSALTLGIPKGCSEYIDGWGELDDESIEYALRATAQIVRSLNGKK